LIIASIFFMCSSARRGCPQSQRVVNEIAGLMPVWSGKKSCKNNMLKLARFLGG
jgi:hypothetical protein